ncbi:thiamine pyrophosphate-dependent dehydrogenase E1 component subunit alpha [Dermacoccus barathri]|uniref:thiamine pyrophosphate-dependent dehydrogenase E1 component subunit alpha n=1 Tax=Dermacoccus barathri TaxID=322601 RepID=UPI00187A4162|nr:thiamine pyrophosphate-dependent dehydrogenase E1 component subunit alpha [Dermacoccus barathri]MBE7370535.1 thiamine pyrophosphate-dependent dehydrogenase E1 component subunit alpha [Dermacoccus barathri]
MTISGASEGIDGVTHVAGHKLDGLPDVTDGGPDMVQLIAPDGSRTPMSSVNEPYVEALKAITAEEVRAMYRDMVLVRRFDIEGYSLQRQGELGLWPQLLGQEAAQVAAGHAMREQDFAYPGYREHGVAFCRGITPAQVFATYRGVSHGGWNPADHNFATFTIVIGNQMLNAAGYAMGVRLDGLVGTGDDTKDTAVIAFTGDGGTSQGDFNEAMVYAAVNHSPMVFFIQNNGWAISEPNTRQFIIPPYKRADGFGFPGVRTDGNDVLATWAVTRRSLDNARSGLGPTLIEAFTYRMGAHTTSDDPTRYREDAHVEAWKAKDPIARLRALLERENHADASFFGDVDAEAKDLAAGWRRSCVEMADPEMTAMFDHAYIDLDPQLRAQREEFAEYLASFEEASA